MRPERDRIAPSGPTVAEFQASRTVRATAAAQGAADDAGSAANDEFIVIAGPGSHLTAAAEGGRDTGRLVLTTRRLFRSTRRPDPAGHDRSWLVRDLRGSSAGPRTLT
jgi:hypothetical protein